MRGVWSGSSGRRCLAGIVLFAFVLRALIPAGFMPSAERPFSLEFCPSSFPAAWLATAGHSEHAQHHHSGHAQHHHSEHSGPDDAAGGTGSGEKSGFEHCPYGSVPSAAPIAEPGIALLGTQTAAILDSVSVTALPTRLVRSQQARAPPGFS